jgi:hypothetical protein
MTSETRGSVVILYEHALLGEGIAQHVLTHCGVQATVVPAHDVEAVTSALALDPSIVIFELTEPLQQGDLATVAPHALLIDISGSVTRGSVLVPDADGLERILRAVRAVTSVISNSA